MPIRYIDQLKDIKGKKVFIRVDFNVPQDEKGNITEDTRIAGAVPTIKYAVEQGAKVVLASHLGRPKGEKKVKYTMAPAAKRLSQLLGKKVVQAPDCFGPEVDKLVDAMKPGDVVMLENVRFYPGEEKKRSCLCQTTGERLRDLHQRRFCRVAPCPCLGGGDHQDHSHYRCRLPDEKRDDLFRQGDEQPGAAVGGHSGRSQGVR